MNKAKYSRRFFIGGALSFGAFAGCGKFAKSFAATDSELMKLGVLSDIHINTDAQVPCFIRALEFFRSRKVDGVLIAGDMADNGRVDQLERVADAWFRVFPNGKGMDGKEVKQLFIYGNHDMHGPLNKNPKGEWERLFHEEWSPIMKSEVKGIPIIRAHWPIAPGGNQIEAWMKEHGKEIDPSLPFVYTQHDHPKNTCFNGWAWGHDDGRATRALSPFPNAVAFSGHSHYTLTDERSYYQGAFTSINTSSLRYISTDYSLRENIGGNGSGFRGEKRDHRMKQFGTGDGNQGQVVSFWRDHLAIERREFCYGESLGDEIVVPLPAAEGKPFSYAARAAKRSAPEFAEGAVVEVELVAPKNEKDFHHIELTFPAAVEVNRCRVSEYEVTAVLVEDDVELVQAQRRIMSPDHYLPRTKLINKLAFTFAAEDLPIKGHYRFEVRALECFGRKSGKIDSPIMTIA